MKIESFDGDYRWLSNFWLCPIVKGDHVYPSTENAYQASKYPKSERQQFTTCSPAMAKKLGQRIDNPKNWPTEKLVVMRQVLEQKFRQGTFNATLLACTGVKEIIEGNTWGDVFWGVCDGVGENNLGRILMEIRADLT
jgi:hypothetical protein